MVDAHNDRALSLLTEGLIREQRILPFLGAGASFPALPLGSTIAGKWAREYNYPGDNPKNLIEVAEFLAIKRTPLFVKKKILEEVTAAAPPDFNATDEPHGLLADLPLPIYLTTNYDDFMVRALRSRLRDAHREFCRWNELIKDEPSVFDNDFSPTVANPVVFHLHGHTIPKSIVITESDYLAFLATVGRGETLPRYIQMALARLPCLFIGYRLADWNFRVLLLGLGMKRDEFGIRHGVAVLKPPGDDELAQRQCEYLDHYYAKEMHLKVYWGTAREFTAEFRRKTKPFWNSSEL
jgi:hypothetical protein